MTHLATTSKILLTFNPVNERDTNLLFLLSSDNFKARKHIALSSCEGFRNRLFCPAKTSVKHFEEIKQT